MLQVENKTAIRVIPEESITFPAAEHFRANIMKLSEEDSCNVILDCKNLKRIDVTVAKVSLRFETVSLIGMKLMFLSSVDNRF